MKELYIIVNEKIYRDGDNFFCENKDVQSTINYLSYKYYLIIISRYSAFVKPFRLHKVVKIFNFRLIKIFHLFIFLFSFSRKKKVFIISITPYNFFIFFIFKFFFDCKFYLYLRSNGYEEYESILGKKYIWIYDFMFKYITKYSEVISCHNRLYNKKCHILYPSELNLNWKKRVRKNNFKNNKIHVLYVGRFKVEKGVYSLLKLFSKMPCNIKLTLVGNGDSIKITDDRIKVINFVNNEKRIISIYDSANILILPSYTEAHPKVIDESLARMRPVIVFNDIKYVIQKRYGVFSIKRSASQLERIINYIKRNDKLIFNQLKKNKLPQRMDFLENLDKIISLN
jgi:glycosyltransferase involved in cell wall biosynthesis